MDGHSFTPAAFKQAETGLGSQTGQEDADQSG